MTNLIALDDYKSVKDVTKTIDDAKLEQMIAFASAAIKNYCKVSFIDYYNTPKVEYITNLNPLSKIILLQEWPIRDITSIEYFNNDTGLYELIDNSTYYLDKNIDGVVHRSVWPVGEGALKVTYRGGYETTPHDIAIATIDYVHHLNKEEYKERRTLGDASLDYATGGRSVSQPKWPNHIMRILEMYRYG